MRHRPPNYRYYSCGWHGIWGRYGSVMFICLSVVFWTIGGVQYTVEEVSLLAEPQLTVIVGIVLRAVLAALIFTIPFIAAGLVGAHRFSDIGVGPDGLAVQVYVVCGRLIPWGDVLGVRPRKYPGVNVSEIGFIMVRKLTIWHSLLSYQLDTSVPSVIITRYHEDYQELLIRVLDGVSSLKSTA